MSKRIKMLATGGVTAAACVVVLYLASVLPTLTLALTAAAGVILVFDVMRCGRVFSLGVYLVVCILAFLLLPSKEPAVWFALLFGLYPILKHIFEGCQSRAMEWLLKIVYVALSLTVMLFGLHAVLPIPEIIMKNLWLVYPAFIAVFIIYDIAFTRLIGEMARRLPKK